VGRLDDPTWPPPRCVQVSPAADGSPRAQFVPVGRASVDDGFPPSGRPSARTCRVPERRSLPLTSS